MSVWKEIEITEHGTVWEAYQHLGSYMDPEDITILEIELIEMPSSKWRLGVTFLSEPQLTFGEILEKDYE